MFEVSGEELKTLAASCRESSTVRNALAFAVQELQVTICDLKWGRNTISSSKWFSIPSRQDSNWCLNFPVNVRANSFRDNGPILF
jgi:hypothetical protein